jgi:hypothetical protein
VTRELFYAKFKRVVDEIIAMYQDCTRHVAKSAPQAPSWGLHFTVEGKSESFGYVRFSAVLSKGFNEIAMRIC